MLLSNCFVPNASEDRTNDKKKTSPIPGSLEEQDGKSLRPLACGIHVIKGASGSAQLSLGDTHVYCSVYGPRANRIGGSSSSSSSSIATGGNGVFCDLGALECDVRLVNDRDLGDAFQQPGQRLSHFLKDALESAIILSLYPKATISIYAVITNAHGSELAALISCASLALTDACIEMNDLVCGVAIGIMKQSSRIDHVDSTPRRLVVDPKREDYPQLASVLTLSMMVNRDCFTHLTVEGQIVPQELSSVVELARSGCQCVRDFLVRHIIEIENIVEQ